MKGQDEAATRLDLGAEERSGQRWAAPPVNSGGHSDCGCKSHDCFNQRAAGECMRGVRGVRGVRGCEGCEGARSGAWRHGCLITRRRRPGTRLSSCSVHTTRHRRHFVKCKSRALFPPCLHHRSSEWPPQAQRQQMSRSSQISPPRPVFSHLSCFLTDSERARNPE